ncbi:MAG: group 1 truncated hemoglobin [Ignavibacteriales bacterium]|nr:group 1 truncated hemoglobin [Ignavibacteriales bacterium]
MNKNRSSIARIIMLIAFVCLFFNTTNYFAQQKTLYQRLGGVRPISLVVDDFIDRLVSNDALNANPMIKAGREHSPAPYLKVQVTNLVCQVTGGPCVYTGLGMKESHMHLNITEMEWQVMRDEFKKSLDKFGVPEKEQKELFDIVESTKKDIVQKK